MHRRRWLIVGLCFCVFSGCVACQSNYDYCGPMPDQGGDFMYRKNSVLGGDPAMKRIDDEPKPAEGEAADETGPEPTPAPPPDEAPTPGMEMDETTSGSEPNDDAEEESQPQASYEADEDDVESDEDSVSTLQWHAPLKREPAPVQQVRFRGGQ